LVAGRRADAAALFAEASAVHPASPYPPLNLALLALRRGGENGGNGGGNGGIDGGNGEMQMSPEAVAAVVSHLRDALRRHFAVDPGSNPIGDGARECDNPSDCGLASPSSSWTSGARAPSAFEAATACASSEPDEGAARLHYFAAVLLAATANLRAAAAHAEAALGCLGGGLAADLAASATSHSRESSSNSRSRSNSRRSSSGGAVPGVGGVAGGGAESSRFSNGRRPRLNVPEVYPLPSREKVTPSNRRLLVDARGLMWEPNC
jgi:hypothetical protein